MSSLRIIRPITPVRILGGLALARTLTPDPKEAAGPLLGESITLDFGVPVTIDTVFMGYHTATNGQQWAVGVYDETTGGINQVLVGTQSIAAPGIGPPFHGLVTGEPLTSRYWQLQTNGGPDNIAYTIGVIAFGLSFQPTYGHEYGSGRLVTDTGSAERLFGGGFGINEGARAGGWQFTMGDLTDAEIRTLYRLALDRGTTRSVVVVEDPDRTDGLNERIHWGLFSKLDAYERFAPGASRWALRIDDWA